MLEPRCLILERSLPSAENMEKDSATALFPCHDNTLAPLCCGFPEQPAGPQPWSESPAQHMRMETVEETVPYPRVAQEQGEELGCCKQRAIHALSLSHHLCSSSWDLPGEQELSPFSWELPQAHLLPAWLPKCPSNGEERRPQEDNGYREALTFTQTIHFQFLYSKQSIF